MSSLKKLLFFEKSTPMKKTILLCAFLCVIKFSLAQPEEAKRLVDEGVTLHDRGDYQNAIAKYDLALKMDPDNLLALSEKAYSLLSLGNPEESESVCKRALEKHKGSAGLRTVYVTYGNALDLQKQPKKSLAIYNEGIKKFPDFYLLHFNKAITLVGLEKFDDATESLQTSMNANPVHASSHNAMARILEGTNKKIPALLAYTRFLSLEQNGKRASQNAANLVRILGSGAKQTGENAVTISVDASMMKQAGAKSKKENDFSSAELFLSMGAALDYDEKNKKKPASERFATQIESLFSMLEETTKDNSGFFWEYYVPYCVEMKEKKFIETFSNIVTGAAGDSAAGEWLVAHPEEVEMFGLWAKGWK
jgi:tetratricopeptide (TPR) repeat protein